MFAWYLDQIKNFSIARATRSLFRVIWRRTFAILNNMTLPARLICPCCERQGRRFFEYIEMGYTVPNAACPLHQELISRFGAIIDFRCQGVVRKRTIWFQLVVIFGADESS